MAGPVMPAVGDLVHVEFTARVERTGDTGTGRRFVYAGGFWLSPDVYEQVEEQS